MYGNYILACLPCLEPTMAFIPPLLKKTIHSLKLHKQVYSDGC